MAALHAVDGTSVCFGDRLLLSSALFFGYVYGRVRGDGRHPTLVVDAHPQVAAHLREKEGGKASQDAHLATLVLQPLRQFERAVVEIVKATDHAASTLSSTVAYGQTVRLKHSFSGLFITLSASDAGEPIEFRSITSDLSTPQTPKARRDMPTSSVDLHEDLSASSLAQAQLFRMLPKYSKIRKEGDGVRLGDQVIFQHLDSGRVLASGDVDSMVTDIDQVLLAAGKAEDKVIGIVASRLEKKEVTFSRSKRGEAEIWTLHGFDKKCPASLPHPGAAADGGRANGSRDSERGPGEAPAVIKAGNIISLHHVESDCFLAVQPRTIARPDWLPDLGVPLPAWDKKKEKKEAKRTSECFVERGSDMHNEFSTYSALWAIERDEPQKGGVVTLYRPNKSSNSGLLYRLRHLETNKYLNTTETNGGFILGTVSGTFQNPKLDSTSLVRFLPDSTPSKSDEATTSVVGGHTLVRIQFVVSKLLLHVRKNCDATLSNRVIYEDLFVIRKLPTRMAYDLAKAAASSSLLLACAANPPQQLIRSGGPRSPTPPLDALAVAGACLTVLEGIRDDTNAVDDKDQENEVENPILCRQRLLLDTQVHVFCFLFLIWSSLVEARDDVPAGQSDRASSPSVFDDVSFHSSQSSSESFGTTRLSPLDERIIDLKTICYCVLMQLCRRPDSKDQHPARRNESAMALQPWVVLLTQLAGGETIHTGRTRHGNHAEDGLRLIMAILKDQPAAVKGLSKQVVKQCITYLVPALSNEGNHTDTPKLYKDSNRLAVLTSLCVCSGAGVESHQELIRGTIQLASKSVLHYSRSRADRIQILVPRPAGQQRVQTMPCLGDTLNASSTDDVPAQLKREGACWTDLSFFMQAWPSSAVAYFAATRELLHSLAFNNTAGSAFIRKTVDIAEVLDGISLAPPSWQAPWAAAKEYPAHPYLDPLRAAYVKLARAAYIGHTAKKYVDGSCLRPLHPAGGAAPARVRASMASRLLTLTHTEKERKTQWNTLPPRHGRRGAIVPIHVPHTPLGAMGGLRLDTAVPASRGGSGDRKTIEHLLRRDGFLRRVAGVLEPQVVEKLAARALVNPQLLSSGSPVPLSDGDGRVVVFLISGDLLRVSQSTGSRISAPAVINEDCYIPVPPDAPREPTSPVSLKSGSLASPLHPRDRISSFPVAHSAPRQLSKYSDLSSPTTLASPARSAPQYVAASTARVYTLSPSDILTILQHCNEAHRLSLRTAVRHLKVGNQQCTGKPDVFTGLVDYIKGDTVLSEGAISDRVYYVVHGELNLSGTTVTSPRSVCAGEVMNPVAQSASTPWTASVVSDSVRLLEARVVDITATAASARDGGAACEDQSDASVAQLSLGPHDSGSHRYYDVVDEVAESASFSGTDGASEPSTDEASSADEGCKADPLDDERWPWHRHILVTGLKTALERFLSSNSVLVTTNVARNVLLAEWLSLLSNLIDLDLYTEEELDILLPLLANILDPDTDVVDEATPSFSPGRVERYRFPHPLSDDVDLDLKRRTTKPLSTSYRGATGASPAPTSLPHKHESELSPPRSRHMVMSPSLNFSAATQRGASACLAKLRSGSLMSPRITRAASISAEATTVSPPAIACVKSATGLSTATAPDITAMASTLNGHTGSAQRPSNELLVVTRAKLQVCRIFLKLLAAPGGSPASPTTGETGSDSSDEVDVASPMSCLTQGHRSGSDVSSALAGSPRGLISHLSASWQLQTAADDCVRGDVRNAAFLLNLQNILLRVMRYKASRDLFVTAFRLYLLISSHREKMAAGGGPSPSSASSKTLEEHLRDELADDALNEEDSLLLRLVEHCKAFSHRGDSTVDLSQDEENETIIAALSYLRSVIQVPASLTQPAYSSLEQRQNKLNSLGAMRIVINTVDSTSRTEVQEEVVKGGLELAIALLQGGNHEVQSWLRDYFFARRDETLFVVLRDRITKAMSSIDRSLSEAQKREESGEWSSVADLPIDCPASPSFAGPLFHVAETMRFLQLCTEGHNTALQNYFRVQEDNVQSHDLVRESLKFLSSLNSLQRQVRGQEVQMSDFCLRAAVQTWNTLTEFCQGPVPDNQTTLIEGDIGLEVNRVFLTKGSGPLISEVQNAAVITMLSVVEGCTTLFAPLSLRRSLNLDLLLDRICSISEDEREDTEFGYNVYLLLSFLCDYDSYSQWEDVEVAAMLDPSRNPARASVLSFYRARTAQVEIMRGGSSLERVYFRKPTACLGLTRRARKKLLDNVNRGVDQARLVDFFDRVEETVFELELIYAASDTGRASADLAQSGTTLHDRVHKWSPIVRWIGHGVVLVCNVALLFASTKHAETRPSIWGLGFLAHPDWGFIDVGDCMLPVAVYGLVFTLVLALAGIIWVGLLDYAWFEGPVLLFSRDRERRRKQGRYSVAAYISTDHPFRDEGWTFDRRKLPFTTVVVQSLDELSFLQQVTGLVACGLSLVVSPFFVSLLLLSLLTESAVIRHVFNAVTRNGKSLLLAMLLGMILMYLFAVVGFVLFRDNFNGEGDANCSSMLRCFVFTVTDGLRAGGGIGEVMAAPQWGSDLHGFRLLYDMAFFLFVTVIFMNIVFGIIVDTFGELRQKREAREHELRTRCFICNVSSSEFDKRADGFANHVARDHNMWNYLFFVFYLAKKPRDELTGQESFVVDCLTKNDFKFVPLNTSLALKQESAFAELQASAEITVPTEEFRTKVKNFGDTLRYVDPGSPHHRKRVILVCGLELTTRKQRREILELVASTEATEIAFTVVTDLQWKEQVTLLGLTIDDRLTFKAHVDRILQSAGKRVNLVKLVSGMKWGHKTEVLQALYMAYAWPVLMYGIAIYGPYIAQEEKDRLERLHRTALVAATGCKKTTLTSAVLMEARMLPIESMADVRTGALGEW
ncbi:Inositol 1 [Diplonema papillatum]|nr:Inositol 1 [Diplonema papillatum]